MSAFAAEPVRNPLKLARAWWRVVGAVLTLRLRPWASIGNSYAAHRAVVTPAATPERWQTRANELRAAARLVPGAHCLARSLALLKWLRDSGVAAELRIGVLSEHGSVRSHSWVVLDGTVLDDDACNVARFQLIQGVSNGVA
jgi:hypothetical protein